MDLLVVLQKTASRRTLSRCGASGFRFGLGGWFDHLDDGGIFSEDLRFALGDQFVLKTVPVAGEVDVSLHTEKPFFVDLTEFSNAVFVVGLGSFFVEAHHALVVDGALHFGHLFESTGAVIVGQEGGGIHVSS